MSDKIDTIINSRKKRGGTSKAPDDMTLMAMYVDMSAKQIGDKYGVAESTVRGWITAARKRLRAGTQSNE